MTWRRFGLGLVLFPAWLVVIFVTSLLYGGEGYPPLSGGIVAGVVMVAIAWLLASRVTHAGPRTMSALGVSWLAAFVSLQLFITIPNGTVNVVFGSAATYFTYAGIAAGFVVAARRHRVGVGGDS